MDEHYTQTSDQSTASSESREAPPATTHRASGFFSPIRVEADGEGAAPRDRRDSAPSHIDAGSLLVAAQLARVAEELHVQNALKLLELEKEKMEMEAQLASIAAAKKADAERQKRCQHMYV